MLKNILSLLFIIPFAISCTLSDRNLEQHTISLDNLGSNMLDVESLSLVRLKENQFSQIVNVEKVIHADEHFIISDKSYSKAVFIYDLNGEYINHIHENGVGPKEFKFIQEVIWDEEHQKLWILPMDLPKEMVYDPKGSFVEEFKVNPNSYVKEFVVFGKDRFTLNLSHMDFGDNVVLNKELGLDKSWFPFDEKLDNSPIVNVNSLFKSGDRAIFSIGARDTIYEYNHKTEEVSVKFAVDYGRRKIPDDYFSLPYEEQFQQFWNSNSLAGINDLYEVGKYITFMGFSSEGFEVFIYDMKNEVLYDSKNLFSEYLKGAYVERILGVTKEGKFIGTLNSKDIKSIKEMQSIMKNFESFDDIDREDKVLVLFSLK